ncbi:AI-2E family transporter [Barrientosiimonas endolithica]|nr:AI-2E family transporter [Barrientosiimonas endolithica]
MPRRTVAQQTDSPPTRAAVIGDGVKWTASWALRIAVILLSLWVLMKALAPLWIAILPILLGLVIATVLWPPVRWLRSKGCPGARRGAVAAAGLPHHLHNRGHDRPLRGLAGAGAGEPGERRCDARAGLAGGPPLNIRPQDIDSGVQAVTGKLTESGSQIASGVLGGVSSTVSVLVSLVLALILAFFMVKDGPKFLPWTRRVCGERAGGHLTELLSRMWKTLGGFIRAQALVSLVDAVFIGLGLFFLGIPLWLPLAVITFFGGFIPIVGATVAGALAVLVALVSTSLTKALLVLLLVLAVQQIEGNVLQPILQSRTMSLHPGLVILSVTVGSSMRGVIGAFLAVPAAALLVVLLRYLQEQIDLRSGEKRADELDYLTEEGQQVAQVQQSNAVASQG